MTAESIRRAITAKVLRLICLCILCGILVACLWPFHSPKNEVTWLGNENGLRFGRHGTVLSSGSLKIGASRDQPSCTLEIWLQPGLTHDSNTILALYTPENPLQFSLHQSDSDLVLQGDARDRQHTNRIARLHVDDIFREGRAIFITITLSPQITAIYANGILVKTARGSPLPLGDLVGQLVVGDSPVGPDSWSGKLLGLAIYDWELTEPQVYQHFQRWTTKGRPDITSAEGTSALYLLDEQGGRTVHNQNKSGVDLYIPERYMIVDQIFLETPWKEFYVGWSYWKNVLINIVGFIPLGFFFCIYFVSVSKLEKAALTTIILGFTLSLTVETLQAYLPTRQSGMTDVITNTLGTCIGVALCRCKATQDLYRKLGTRMLH